MKINGFNLVIVLLVVAFTGCSNVNKAEMEKAQKDKKIASINVQLGLGYLEQGDIERSKQKLLYALQKDPSLPEAWYSMAYFYEITGNKKQAEKYYLTSLKMAPNRGDVENNYGTYLCRTGRYKKSIHYFIKATQDMQYLDTASAYENAGLCALKMPNRNLAMKYFSQALETDPSRITSIKEINKLRSVKVPKILT